MFPSKTIFTATTGSAGSQATVEFRNESKLKKAYGGFLMKLKLRVTAGASVTGVAADLVSVLQHAFRKFTLRYRSEDLGFIFNNLSGSDLRKLFHFLEENELKNNIIGTSYTSGSDYWAEVTVPILFQSPKHKGKRRLMGNTQFRELVLEFAENDSDTISASAATMTRKAGVNMSVDILPLSMPSPHDDWISPLSIRKLETQNNILKLHDGLTLAILEDSAVHDSSALTKWNVDIGEERILENAKLEYIREEYERELDQGGVNVLALATAMYIAPKSMPEEDLPHGTPVVEQFDSELTAPKLRQYFYPAPTGQEGEIAARTKAETTNSAVLATKVIEPALGSNARGAMTLQPVRLLPPSDANFSLRNGIMADPSGHTRVHVSDQVIARGLASAAAAGNRTAAQASALKSQKLALAQIPGAVDTAGKGKPSEARTAIRKQFGRFF